MNFSIRALLLAVLILVSRISSEAAVSTTVVISQIYTGLAGSTGPSDAYVEIFNKGVTTVDLTTWTLQYSNEGASTWQIVALSGSLAPGQYYLIRANSVGGRGRMPQPDKTTLINLGIDAGKIALLSTDTSLVGACPSFTSVVDFLGYGSGCREGSSPTLATDGKSLHRKGAGCTETDNNLLDFGNASPQPRNTVSARSVCESTTAVGRRTFSIADRGATTFRSSGTPSGVSVGYARIQPDTGKTAPSGVAVLGFRSTKLVYEVGFPATTAITRGLFYAEINGPRNTGLAIANPNNQDVTVDFTVAATFDIVSTGSITIPANTQVAKFLNELPYDTRDPLVGTFSFTASAPVAVTALRGFTNERSEFLFANLPVVDLSLPPSTAVAYIPHFAVNGGWTTDVILVNTADFPISGKVEFFNPGGTLTSVPVGTSTVSSVEYNIPQKGALKLNLPDMGGATLTGSVRVTPTSGVRTPVSMSVFSLYKGGVRVTEAGVIGVAGTQLRTYVEESGVPDSIGSIQAGIAIANMAALTSTVDIELLTLDGVSTGLTSSVTVPSGGQTSRMVKDLFPSLARPFKGIMRVTSSNSISVLGLRIRNNEQGDFLISTLSPSNELTTPSSAETFFPHLADGAGHSTEFTMFTGATGQTTSGVILFRTNGGQNLGLGFQ